MFLVILSIKCGVYVTTSKHRIAYHDPKLTKQVKKLVLMHDSLDKMIIAFYNQLESQR